ncbi:RNA-dependent DNA polymerase [Pseudoscourfieldia marina]
MPLWQLRRRRGAKTLTKNARRSLRMKGFLNSSVHSATSVGKSRSNIPPTAPTHALEEDADAEAVARHRAQFARRITSANRPQAVITCTTISRNLLSLVRLAANGGTSRSARLELYDNERKHVPHQDRRQLLRVEVAPPLDFDMTIDTTFHQSPARIRYPCARGTTSAHRDSLISTKRKSRLALRPEQNSANIRHHRHRHQETHAPLSRCVEGKAHDIPKHRQSERTDRVGGALVHTDIKTDVPTPSYRGDKYFIHFTDDKTRHTVPYALRKKSDSQTHFCAALANNIHTGTTPPYDKKAGGRHERIIDTLLDACHGHIIRAPHVPRKYWPIVLKTVAIIYNNMTHGATDKIPSIELFRSPTISLRSALSATSSTCTYPSGSATQCAAWEAYIYLGFKDAHGAYVYDPVTV